MKSAALTILRAAILSLVVLPVWGIWCLYTVPEAENTKPIDAPIPAEQTPVLQVSANHRMGSSSQVDPVAYGWQLLQERQTHQERIRFDHRTIQGDRPQDWYSATILRWEMAKIRADYHHETAIGAEPTTRALTEPTRRFARTGPYARLTNDILRARPKTRFIAGYINQQGRYVGSSFYRQAAFARPVGSYHNMWVTTSLSNASNFYIFRTSGRSNARSFINGYFERAPVFAPGFYRHVLGGHRVTHGVNFNRLLDKAIATQREYYGRGSRALGWQARMRESLVPTVQPRIKPRVANVVFFRHLIPGTYADRGWGTYNREYYRPPIPRVYRDVNWHLQTHPVAHQTPFTTP